MAMTQLGIDSLVNPLLVAKKKDARAMMASSYDRRGGNHDWSNYVRREGSETVLMEAAGPGCVTRIWTADPQKGTIRVFLDGALAIEAPFAELFNSLPLSSGIGGESPENYARSKNEHVPMGYTSYCPIPFQRHCKVTIEPEDDYLYYQINADLYPPGDCSPEFDTCSKSIQQAASVLDSRRAGRPLLDMSQASRFVFDLDAGESKLIFDNEGAGVVRGLLVNLPPDLTSAELEHARENVWLVGHFDDDEPRDPSIRAPLGPMFLDYGQEPRPNSLFLGYDDAYYCFFPMPHHDRAKLLLANRSLLRFRVSTAVLHESHACLDPDLLRFRATWHIETPFGPDHRDYEGLACRLLNLNGAENVELLNVDGAGHFVGCGFCADMRASPTDRACGEGDEMFFVDDDPRLTLYGTGTEDYVNDAWGISGYSGPLSGDAVNPETVDQGPQLFGYRLHIADPVPFSRKGRFTLEHGTGNNCSGLYRSVAYWYMNPARTRTRTEERRWEAIRTGQTQVKEGPADPQAK